MPPFLRLAHPLGRPRLVASATFAAMALAVLPSTALAQASGSAIGGLNPFSLLQAIPSGTGYAALDLCSRALSVGDDFTRVKLLYTAPKVAPLPLVWTVIHTTSKVHVTAALLYPRKAILRPGLGCTVIPPSVSESAVRAQPFRPAPALPPDGRSWPLGEGPAETAALSPARQAVLQKAAQAMFNEPTTAVNKRVNTNALVVAQDGRLVYERYAAPFDRDRQQLGWSMTKTLTALIAGTLEHDGRLSLDGPVGLPAWQGTDKARITWRQLLNMAPGLQWNEGDYGIGPDDTTNMLFSQADQCAWVAAKPLVVAPGTEFNYSTGFSTLALCGVKALLGGSHQQVYDHYQQRLFAPLGIRGGHIEPDAAGSPVGGARGMLRPVDWLRLGQLVAQGGQWQGQTLLSPTFMRFLVGPSPANAGYGGSLWRQPAGTSKRDQRAAVPSLQPSAFPDLPRDLMDQLPPDMVIFRGVQSQNVVVVPSRGLVLLRMGVAHDPTKADRQTYQLVIDLLATP